MFCPAFFQNPPFSIFTSFFSGPFHLLPARSLSPFTPIYVPFNALFSLRTPPSAHSLPPYLRRFRFPVFSLPPDFLIEKRNSNLSTVRPVNGPLPLPVSPQPFTPPCAVRSPINLLIPPPCVDACGFHPSATKGFFSDFR